MTNAPDPHDKAILLTEVEAAKQLGISRRTLQRWRRKGAAPTSLKITSRYVRYTQYDIDVWLDQQRRADTGKRASAKTEDAIAIRRRLQRTNNMIQSVLIGPNPRGEVEAVLKEVGDVDVVADLRALRKAL